ncbi:MAG: ATP-dependent zinc metalloprotease FtsH, partial [Sedimentisphaerales bacterium]|nr:ATP-dependent zinc metalloprotease FtsH [Sedimentisphaerales bacterium]
MSKSLKPESDKPSNDGSRRRLGPLSSNSAKGPRNPYNWLLLLALCCILALMLGKEIKGPESITMTKFKERVAKQVVEKVEIYETELIGYMKPDSLINEYAKSSKKFKVTLLPDPKEKLETYLEENQVPYELKHPSGIWTYVLPLVPWLLLIFLMYFLFFRQFRGAGGAGMLGSFGRSRHRVSSKDQVQVTFDDVAGIDEAKEEVTEIIEFLKNPKRFQRLGGRIPRGILLIGEPGCGKTLLAKAIAGEADVPFFSISGSDFVEMFVGVGASRVRDLFKQAKENSPCIIFLDEIDAVGRKRGTSVVGGHDEREQTLNAILVEMDGFTSSDQVIVIAATNRSDVLDHALTRPGRFDRQVYVPLPDVKGRYEILKVHARKVKLGHHVDLHRLARGTPMFSGADLEAIINEAALHATMQNKDFVEMVDLEEARDKVRWGRARRSRQVDEKEKLVTAYHEAGHALVQTLLEDADPVHKVSIIPRGHMGGATFSLPEKDRMFYTRKFCIAQIKICFGGRVAEEIFCHDISSGAAMDIKMATDLARHMLMEWGMSDKLG